MEWLTALTSDRLVGYALVNCSAETAHTSALAVVYAIVGCSVAMALTDDGMVGYTLVNSSAEMARTSQEVDYASVSNSAEVAYTSTKAVGHDIADYGAEAVAALANERSAVSYNMADASAKVAHRTVGCRKIFNNSNETAHTELRNSFGRFF